MKHEKVYLHVGLQKTATTFLQEKLFPKMSGVSYVGRPYTQENDAFNSLQYADGALYCPDMLARELAVIRRATGNSPLLISDELFAGYAGYGMINRGIIADRLAELVPHAEVILFLRGQADLIESLYNQYVKIGSFSNDLNGSFLYEHGNGFPYRDWDAGRRTWDFKERRYRHQSLFSTSHFLYSKLLDLYETRFSKVHVFLYEDFKQNPEQSILRLEQVLSAKFAQRGQPRKKMVNSSLNENELRLKIIQNRLSSALPPGHRKKYAKLLAEDSSLFNKMQSREEREKHVVGSLSRGGVFEDNMKLNKSRKLGMEQHADKYFARTL